MYHFIINSKSKSGKGIRIWTTVKKELEAKNVSYFCYFTKYMNHAMEITKDICKEYKGIKTIVVLGGDGTVNEVINGIDDFNNVIFGYIPTGSSNDLARSLKLSKDPLERLKSILLPTHFDFVDIGVIKLNGLEERKFCVSSGIGYDAATCEETFRSPLKKFLNRFGLGKLTYILIALKQLVTSPFMDGEIVKDGVSNQSYKNMLLVTSMIHRYEGGGISICPKANPRDGKLSVCIAYGLTRLQVFVLLPTLMLGKHTNFKGIEIFDCTSLDVHVKNPSPVHTDGEYPGAYQDINITCLPKQLRIIL